MLHQNLCPQCNWGHPPVVHLCSGLFTPPGLEYTATSCGLQTWISELQVQFRGNDSLECRAVVDVSFINIETGTVPFPETVLILATWDNLGQCVSVCVYMLARKGTGQGWEVLVTSRSRGPCTGPPSPTCTHALPLPISPPPCYVPPHLSLWQQKEEGRERAMEGKEERHVADN